MVEPFLMISIKRPPINFEKVADKTHYSMDHVTVVLSFEKIRIESIDNRIVHLVSYK